MLMSDMAVRELVNSKESFFESCRRVFLSIFGRSSDHRLPAPVIPTHSYTIRTVRRNSGAAPCVPRALPSPLAPVVAVGPESPQQWRRHPQLRTSPQSSMVASPCRRSARLEAERGMILARGGKFPEALDAFTTAASDPHIDLTALPGFWDLSRQGMVMAVRAYERTSRIRDAAALEARIRHTLRPRAIKRTPTVAAANRITASGD